ncbi:hypothetical protein [Kitasatospora sp. LaBMicrA B282]|uniref:hypothetical protein n=1 Tax=Kitasatospora sp. LaBMicrA B282 TaxID=3420949 RepID=UPI003D0995D1
MAALGLLRIAGDGLLAHGPRDQGWEQRAAAFLGTWSPGTSSSATGSPGAGPAACADDGSADADPVAVTVALSLAGRQAELVMELHHGDADGARAWLGELSAAAGEEAREAGASRPAVPVVMAMVWFGIDAIATDGPAPGAVPVCELDPGRALRVVERCEAFLRRKEDHAALVLASARTTAAVLTERMGRDPDRVRAWLDDQAELLLREVGGEAPWWVPDHPADV